MPKKEAVNTERFSMLFPPELYNDLKADAASRGISIGGLVRMLVIKHLKQNGKTKANA